VTSDEAPQARGEKARWLYRKLRRAIELGEYPHDHLLPSEAELTERYGWSQPTVRAPLIQLEAIGRVIKQQGAESAAYMPSKEPHRLDVDLREPSPMPLARVAESEDAAANPAIRFIPAPESQVEKRWDEGEFIVPTWDSKRLGIDTGTKLRTYRLILSIGGEPVLTSTSLVPSDLLGGAVTWREKPVGELALTGALAAFSKATIHCRVPTLDESEALDSVHGTPAFAIYRKCQVTPVGAPVPPSPGCVLVVARADRVHL
jgi:GntR family transcriptional regulator